MRKVMASGGEAALTESPPQIKPLFGFCRSCKVLIRFYMREAASKASGERSHSSGSIDS